MHIRALAKAWAPHPSRSVDYSFFLILGYTPRVSAKFLHKQHLSERLIFFLKKGGDLTKKGKRSKQVIKSSHNLQNGRERVASVFFFFVRFFFFNESLFPYTARAFSKSRKQK